MIIVSQEKNKILNFNNVNMILIRGTQIISFDNTYTDNQDGDLFGIYETEERAKEVLQEIIKAYTGWENYKYGVAEGIGNPKYEMPEK